MLRTETPGRRIVPPRMTNAIRISVCLTIGSAELKKLTLSTIWLLRKESIVYLELKRCVKIQASIIQTSGMPMQLTTPAMPMLGYSTI